MGTRSIAEKLLIKPETAIWVSPEARLPLIGPLPDGALSVGRPDDATTAVVVAEDAAGLRRVLDAHRAALARPNAFWVVYPKANRSDINRDSLWPILTEYGMRPVSQVAVDDVWSALRYRVLKEGEAPFTGGR